MALINRGEQSSHWYTREGKASHTVIGKTTGLPRATTLTDARKLNLIPSVTNVLAMKAKPALNTWLMDNAILSALSTPRRDGELENDWHSRIAEESQRVGREAAEWGTAIHEQVEQYATLGAFMGTGEILAYVEGYADWHRANVVEIIEAEQSIVSPLGYAGRMDLHAVIQHDGEPRRAVIDFKSQKLKGKAKGTFYKEWSMQLAAYADGLRHVNDNTLPLLVSAIIPSDSPGAMQIKVWDNGEDALKAFHSCFNLWCFDKDYTP